MCSADHELRRDHEEVAITQADHDPVVIDSAADHESLKETAYLLRDSKNARRLVTAIDRLESGAGTRRTLAE